MATTIASIGGGVITSPGIPTITIRTTNTVNIAGNTITLEDITGVYDVTTNPTGYGAPNQTRGDFVLFMKGYNKTTKGDVAVTFATYTPTSTLAVYVKAEVGV